MTKVHVISGFLGAGKTTLIKKLIGGAFAGEKVVLLENEYGEIGIDGGFMKDSGIQVTELNSGCICCTLVGDFTVALKELIETYHPDEMAIEELFFNTNQTTAIAVAEARGVILLALKQARVNIAEYTPLQVKQSVVGYGRAEKQQVMEMVRIMLGFKEKIKLDDTADALAIAMCHAHCGGSKIQDFYNQKKKKML